jgi:hypothetical protein
VTSRAYSHHLQRVICDFGAEHAFAPVSLKLQEHYGISVPYTASRQITESHAAQIQARKDLYRSKHQDRACYRYINNRPKQVDYQSAQNQGLPIGSGEVESAHRYVIQKRLKIAGAWWSIEHAKSMLSLRVMRANNLWNQYWKNIA